MTRLLSLDDEPEMGKLIGLILERVGYDVWATSDSYEAWAFLHTLPFDLLMQDVNRPDVDGWVFYRLMRAGDRLDDVAVMMVTAAAHKIARRVDAGLDLEAYLIKPYGPQELMAAVRDVLMRRGKPAPPETEWNKPLPVDERLAALHDADSQRRRAALVAWGWGARAQGWPIEPPIQALGDPERQVRLAAVKALSRLGDRRAVGPLIGVLSGAHTEVRLAASQALGLLRDPRATEPLVGLLRNSDAGDRWAAALALGRMGAAPAVEALITALDDESALVRMAAARSLGRLGAARAAMPLADRLADDDAMVCLAAADALGEIRDPQTVESLLHALGSPTPRVREKAAYALAQIGGPAVAPLIERLGDRDARVRRAVAQVLWLTRDQRVVQPLIAALEDEDAGLVQAAAGDLGLLADARAIPALERIAREDSRVTEDGTPVAGAARRAIEMIRRASDAGLVGGQRV